ESGSSYNSIGGPGVGNVISGNSDLGLCLFHSAANVVQGNFIGADVTGTNALGNGPAGISIDHAANNEIGGTGAGEGNIISGNRYEGVFLGGSSNVVQGNLIGTDASGRFAVPNGTASELVTPFSGCGVWVNGSAQTIGGDLPEARNIISGNRYHGIALDH